jgi:hypothetical protein
MFNILLKFAKISSQFPLFSLRENKCKQTLVCIRKCCKKFWSNFTIMNFATRNFKINRKTTCINCHVNFCRISSYGFTNCFISITGSTCAMLMCFYDASINKLPLKIRILNKRFLYLHQLIFCRPAIKLLVNRDP